MEMSSADVTRRLSEMKAQLDRLEKVFDDAEDLIEQLWDAEVDMVGSAVDEG